MKTIFLAILLITSFLFITKAQIGKPKRGCKKMIRTYYNNPNHNEIILKESDNKIEIINSNISFSKKVFRSWCSGIKIEIAILNDSICKNNSNRDIINYDIIGYHSRFKLRRKLKENNVFIIDSIPSKYRNGNYEINLILSHRKRNCLRISYFGTLGYNYIPLSYTPHTQDIADNFLRKHLTTVQVIQKQEVTNIPFLKGEIYLDTLKFKESISAAGIEPSSVQNIAINAYASVEGDLQLNDSLALRRGEEIKKALISLGYNSSVINVNAGVNWELFYKQTDSEQYSYLNKLSHKEIINKLNSDYGLYASFKNQLDSQRVAAVTIEYAISPLADIPTDKLQKNINTLIAEGKYKQAEQRLFELFGKVYYDSANVKPFDAVNLSGLEKDSLAKHLLGTYRYFNYLLNPKPENYSLSKLTELLKINPNDYDLLYYLTDMKRPAFYSDTKGFLDKIKKIKRYPISRIHINRLHIRYYSGAAAYAFREFKYRNKVKHLNTLYSLLKRTKLSKQDITNVAKMLNSLHENDLAIKLLNPYIVRKKYDEEMLFTYLAIVMPKKKYTHKRNFTILTKEAIEYDKERFMNFFKPNSKGGLSFQILQDEILYHIYCMNR